MNDLVGAMTILAGIAVRLIIPILITALLVHVLRRLAASWQAAARNPSAAVEKPACWEINGSTPACRKDCLGYTSPLPCWQAHRTSNGYLREECLACKVFLNAPAVSPG